MDLDEAEKILCDGTEDQLKELIGKPIAYSYGPKYGGFDVYCESEMSRAYGLFDILNCVKLFGNEYVFGSGSMKDKMAEEYEQYKRSKESNQTPKI